MILKYIFNKQDVKGAYYWLRVGTSGQGSEPSGSIERGTDFY
jgi:hypothetical protein